MSCIVEIWAMTHNSIQERIKYFNNNLLSDVKFVVRNMDGKRKRKQVILAHRFVLSIGSPVFEAMFYGKLVETRDSIELPDCEYDSLLELFRYMYSDEVNLGGSNVMGVLYLAKKYIVPSLADKCTEYLQHNLDPSNVFSILPFVQIFEEKNLVNLVNRCWSIIDDDTEEALKSEAFATIERSLLEAVVVRDTLTIEEIELFKAVDLWATKECDRQGLAAEGEVKRRILGEEVIKRIRFPRMKQKDFASVVLGSGILRRKEIIEMIKYLSDVRTSPVEFSETKRSNVQRCCRFRSLARKATRSCPLGNHALAVSVDKEIALHGVSLFGIQRTVYSVDLNIINSMNTWEPVLVSKTGRFLSELLNCEKYSYYGFKILFDEKIILKKNITYVILARTSTRTQHYSFHGEKGNSSVKCQEVTFTFEKSEYSSNATTVHRGQFPEFFFSCRE